MEEWRAVPCFRNEVVVEKGLEDDAGKEVGDRAREVQFLQRKARSRPWLTFAMMTSVELL